MNMTRALLVVAVSVAASPVGATPQPQPFPRYPVDAICKAEDTKTPGGDLFKHCVKWNQESYDVARSLWHRASPKLRTICYRNNFDSVVPYQTLANCLASQIEMDEFDRQKPVPFKY